MDRISNLPDMQYKSHRLERPGINYAKMVQDISLCVVGYIRAGPDIKFAGYPARYPIYITPVG